MKNFIINIYNFLHFQVYVRTGRPKKDKPLTPKERVKTSRSDPAKRLAENKRREMQGSPIQIH